MKYNIYFVKFMVSIAQKEIVVMHAQAVVASEKSLDELAIEALFQQLLDRWSSGDGQGYGALFTEDADYIGFEGIRSQGRAAIIQWHQYLFDKWLKGSRLQGEINSIRLLSPTVGLMHATGGIVLHGQKHYSARRRSIQTYVLVKEAGKWQFTAFHNSRIQHRNEIQNLLFGIATRLFRW
jgi:uncharacterized protein (TIGR02246 family)